MICTVRSPLHKQHTVPPARVVFYLLFTLTFGALFFTHPFMHYPFDIFTHLQWIDAQTYAQSVPGERYFWHYLWAHIFSWLHIGTSEVFLRAHIIHYVQTAAAFLMLFYSSRVVYRELFPDTHTDSLNFMAYWATLLWFTLFANYSMHHHMVWISWYSVTYQITLPMTLLTLALLLPLFTRKMAWYRQAVHLVLIGLLSYLIIRMHAMEYIYFLLYAGVLLLVYMDKIFGFARRHLALASLLLLSVLTGFWWLAGILRTSSYRMPELFSYLSLEKIPELYSVILAKGALFTSHFSKASEIMNALVYLSLFAVAFMLSVALYRHFKPYDTPRINLRILIFLAITSLFVFIPLTNVTSGFAIMLTYTDITYRFYYSTLLFLALPASVFYLYRLWEYKQLLLPNVTMAFLIAATLFYSYHFSSKHNYYKNVYSLLQMFNEKQMHFNLSEKEIASIGKLLQKYEQTNTSGKPNCYYARGDIAFVIKFIYQKETDYDRRGHLDYLQRYKHHNNPACHPVLFQAPKGFPPYVPYR